MRFLEGTGHDKRTKIREIFVGDLRSPLGSIFKNQYASAIASSRLLYWTMLTAASQSILGKCL